MLKTKKSIFNLFPPRILLLKYLLTERKRLRMFFMSYIEKTKLNCKTRQTRSTGKPNKQYTGVSSGHIMQGREQTKNLNKLSFFKQHIHMSKARSFCLGKDVYSNNQSEFKPFLLSPCC